MLGIQVQGLRVLVLCCRCCGQLRPMLSTIMAWTVASSESVRFTSPPHCIDTAFFLTWVNMYVLCLVCRQSAHACIDLVQDEPSAFSMVLLTPSNAWDHQ